MIAPRVKKGHGFRMLLCRISCFYSNCWWGERGAEVVNPFYRCLVGIWIESIYLLKFKVTVF